MNILNVDNTNNNINNFNIKGFAMFNLFNYMRKVIMPGPKMNIIFQIDQGNMLNLVISYGVTIEQTLKII